MGYAIQLNQTEQTLAFLLVSSTDHITGLTNAGGSLTVTIRKPGGTFEEPAGSVVEVGNGWYEVAGNAADANTLGPLLLHATATGADPRDELFPVVGYDPLSATLGGLATAAGVSAIGSAVTGSVNSLAAAIGSPAQESQIPAHFTNATFSADGVLAVGAFNNMPLDGYALAPAGLDQVEVESGVNARQALSPILAASAGIVSGAGSGVVIIKGGNTTTTRITAVTDTAGNRSSVTLDLPD